MQSIFLIFFCCCTDLCTYAHPEGFKLFSTNHYFPFKCCLLDHNLTLFFFLTTYIPLTISLLFLKLFWKVILGNFIEYSCTNFQSHKLFSASSHGHYHWTAFVTIAQWAGEWGRGLWTGLLSLKAKNSSFKSSDLHNFNTYFIFILC